MPAGNDEALYLGLISGTSRDGADAALVHFHNKQAQLLHAICTPYPAALKAELDAMIEAGERPSKGRAAALDEQLGRFFAATANDLVSQAGVERQDVRAIGSHGQTVWHEPDSERPVSIQLGNGPMIARSTGVTTVTQFRKADLLAGGQGAPLAPLIHREMLASAGEPRAILNIGGIANLTLLGQSGEVSGFDTGPGNCLMDHWTRLHRDQAFDEGGQWAGEGAVSDPLLERMLRDEYFGRPAPKSTGLEKFNASWLSSQIEGLELRPADIQATLAELTAITIVQSLEDFAPGRLLVCGGGVHNSYLLSRISNQLGTVPVESTSQYGLDPDWLEAILFAWLARERLAETPQDTPPITGARYPVLLGKVYTAPGN